MARRGAHEEPGALLLEDVEEAFAELDEARARQAVAEALSAGESAWNISQAGEKGLRRVGRLYEEGTYFLSALIMAGEMFKGLLLQVGEVLPPFEAAGSGRVLLGTVAGDIHDIGKNLVAMALRAHGFLVDDLGVDVDSHAFVEAVRSSQPDLVGLSGLTTASYESMRRTVAALRQADVELPAIPVIVGGASIDEEVGHYVRADAWAADVMQGVRLCQELTGRSGPADSR